MFCIKVSDELFEYLREFETFCKYYDSNIIFEDEKIIDINSAEEQYSDFGIDDIAFFDDNENPLLATVTHEGMIEVREDLFD